MELVAAHGSVLLMLVISHGLQSVSVGIKGLHIVRQAGLGHGTRRLGGHCVLTAPDKVNENHGG